MCTHSIMMISYLVMFDAVHVGGSRGAEFPRKAG